MLQAASEYTTNDWLRLLLFGDPGIGKTTMLDTILRSEYSEVFTPAVCANLDGNINPIVGTPNLFLDVFTEPIGFDMANPEAAERGQIETPMTAAAAPQAWNQFINMLRGPLQKIKPKLLFIDGLTHLGDALLNAITFYSAEAQKNRGVPARSDYNIFYMKMCDFLSSLKGLNCHLILTAHAERYYNAETNQYTARPLCVGKALPQRLPSEFSQIWWMCVNGEGQRGYITHPSGQCPVAKAGLRGLSDGVERNLDVASLYKRHVALLEDSASSAKADNSGA